MPLTDDHQLVSWDDRPATLAGHGLASLVHHGERILAEVPATLRKLRTLMLVLTIAVPAFLAGLLVVLWRLA